MQPPRPARGRRAGLLACVLPASLGFVACSGCASGGAPSAAGTPKPDLVANLDNLPLGTARFDVDARTRRIVAHLSVSGLVPNTAHAVRLRSGSCLNRGGAVVTAFEDAVSGANGAINGDVPATTAALRAVPSGVYLEIHLVGAAQLPANPPPIPIACADIVAAAPTTAVRVTATPGYRPFGSASIAYAGATHTMRVSWNLQAFVGGSSHAAQILSGTCSSPGSLLYALGDIGSDVNGTAKGATTLTGVGVAPPVSGWIVVVRSGPAAAIGTPAAPSPQAQPILCGPLSGGGAASASPHR